MLEEEGRVQLPCPPALLLSLLSPFLMILAEKLVASVRQLSLFQMHRT